MLLLGNILISPTGNPSDVTCGRVVTFTLLTLSTARAPDAYVTLWLTRTDNAQTSQA